MINVFGHLNPDSDAVCTAVVTADWLNWCDRPARAWRTGEVNPETRYIFEAAGLNLPPLLDIPLKGEQVWLVDFTEPAQGPADLPQSNILGIIDHHRLGGLVTKLPPEVWIKPAGSSATVLWLLMDAKMRRSILPAHGTLLLGALLSDTVNLRSPTTTKDDIRTATELCILSGVKRQAFAHGLLAAKTDLTGQSAGQLLNKDLKTFSLAGTDVRIAQLEVSSPDQLAPVLDALQNAMAEMVVNTGTGLVVLMVTDIHECFSTLYFAGPESGNAASCSVPGMVSRKKQLLPWLEHFLSHSRRQL
ncbi:TPA: DHH family phosphoesterase [Klebsiella pneumoniae]|uniref:DHHA2 domain-containing protein n=1 Tax=Enterobacter chuandaensis TaxID=2497875 RepID=UPI00126FCA60|nr:inorganic pyrophosphatase [Salmonella enterica subsp. enterica serovar Agona]ECM4294500.1 inorganic pyrophosphatase [Salmonella enterica subsp. enterica serovar Montevideo]EED3651545.1 inorganic pyrophosphatase [Salmonella enterica subsp. enterica serovar Agona]EHA0437383.1 inorganic pyrophosphatase [Salmonella enterica subsp. enterica serovar Agona]HCT9752571.1 DHH family phosphoesterase [Klebsiella pneumoniae]